MTDLGSEKISISIEEQIARAKERAEEFSKSLQKARSREHDVMQALEREKMNFEQDKSNYEKEKLKSLRSVEDKTTSISPIVKKATAVEPSQLQPVSPIRSDLLSVGGVVQGNKDFENDSERLREEVKRLSVEVAALRSSHRDIEGKLQFRLDQVLICEEEKERLQRANKDLLQRNVVLEAEVAKLRAEVKGLVKLRSFDENEDDEDDDDDIVMNRQSDSNNVFAPESVLSLEELAAADSDIRNVLGNTKAQIYELTRASQTQAQLQRFMDIRDAEEDVGINLSDNDDDELIGSEPVFSKRIVKIANRSQTSPSRLIIRKNQPTVTSSVLQFPLGFDDNRDSIDTPLMRSVTALKDATSDSTAELKAPPSKKMSRPHSAPLKTSKAGVKRVSLKSDSSNIPSHKVEIIRVPSVSITGKSGTNKNLLNATKDSKSKILSASDFTPTRSRATLVPNKPCTSTPKAQTPSRSVSTSKLSKTLMRSRSPSPSPPSFSREPPKTALISKSEGANVVDSKIVGIAFRINKVKVDSSLSSLRSNNSIRSSRSKSLNISDPVIKTTRMPGSSVRNVSHTSSSQASGKNDAVTRVHVKSAVISSVLTAGGRDKKVKLNNSTPVSVGSKKMSSTKHIVSAGKNRGGRLC